MSDRKLKLAKGLTRCRGALICLASLLRATLAEAQSEPPAGAADATAPSVAAPAAVETPVVPAAPDAAAANDERAPPAHDASALPPAATPSGDDAGFFSASPGEVVDPGATYPRLELSGFTDFTFVKNVSSSNSPLRRIVQPRSSFSVGNLNVYFSALIAEKWSVLSEVRFLYLPQGNASYPTAPGQLVVPFDAGALDYANDNRLLTWGGIQIQRVQIDYAFHPLLSLRVGQWLTPVGIWNVDHGSPVVIGVYRPYIVGQGLFPERQTGLQLSGEWSQGNNLLGYAATLSNGRGPSDAYVDLDENKAVGGRAYFTNNDFGSLTVGLSGYKGTYASRNLEFELVTPSGQAPVLDAVSPLTLRYREQSIGGDLRWQFGGLLVQGEVMQHEVVYDEGLHPTANGAIYADYRERGYYALAGYRTPWLGTMPFALFEAYDFGSSAIVAPGWGMSLGLNVRPEPTVVLKLQANLVKLGSDSSTEIYRGTLRRVLTQLAVAF